MNADSTNVCTKVCARYFMASPLLNTNHQTFISRCQCDLARITVSNGNDVFGQ